MNLSSEIIFVLYIFTMGIMLGLILPKIFKKFSLRVPSYKEFGNKFKELKNKFKNKFFPKKLCHCGLSRTAPYCDGRHPFAFRCFRWWRWINENLDERDKGL
jgi:hypothetical protein